MSRDFDIVTLTGTEYDALQDKADTLEAEVKRLRYALQSAMPWHPLIVDAALVVGEEHSDG